MPAPLSIVIPTLNAAEGLPETIAALVPGLEAGLIAELIVSDGGSKDATLEIADAAGAVVVNGSVGRGGQIARGVAVARANWLLILHADTVLSQEWVEAARAHINADQDSAGYFRLKFRARGLWPRFIAAGANLRSRVFSLPYGDQGLLISQSMLESHGGVPDIPLMEDVVLARRLLRQLRQLDAVAATSAARYQRDGWLRRSLGNLVLLARFALGATPEELATRYRPH